MSEAELRALWDDWHRQVLAYALRRTDAATAEDVVNETFLVAWRRLDAPPERPLAWLLAAARRVLANQRRGAARRERLGDRLRAERPAGEDVDRGVREALAALRDADREALLLHAWEGLDNHEAAEVLGCSANAFAVRLHRARARFADALEAQEVAL